MRTSLQCNLHVWDWFCGKNGVASCHFIMLMYCTFPVFSKTFFSFIDVKYFTSVVHVFLWIFLLGGCSSAAGRTHMVSSLFILFTATALLLYHVEWRPSLWIGWLMSHPLQCLPVIPMYLFRSIGFELRGSNLHGMQPPVAVVRFNFTFRCTNLCTVQCN